MSAEPSAFQHSIDRIAGALEALHRHAESPDDAKRQNDDLKAQQDMAFWAMLMFFATLGQLPLSAAGIFLIWKTLKYNRIAAEGAAASAGASLEAANAAKAGIELSRQDFIATHRPRITLRSVTTSEEEVLSVLFVCVNSGGSDATITELYTEILIAGRPLPGLTLKQMEIDPVSLAPGERHLFDSIESQALTDMGRLVKIAQTNRKDDPRNYSAFFIGRIVYYDSLKRRRETGFCRCTNGSINNWVHVNSKEYEYED